MKKVEAKKFLDAVELKRQGWGIRGIARRLGVHRATLRVWFGKTHDQDRRGWGKGTLRKYTPLVRERVIALKRARIDRQKCFLGSPYVQMDYVKRYPQGDAPSLWFIDESVRRAGLQTRMPKKRTQGAEIVKRHRFPVKTIVGLGRLQQSSDFIGKKYIVGQHAPISVFSTSYYQWLEIDQIGGF
ncbi:hypothetical protein B1B_03763 [mine drainage metagenome]|uniref:Transposase n=1 Tax=mine drainage metagenome TaxID=410659 RepID=T1CSU1_9ZZZZ